MGNRNGISGWPLVGWAALALGTMVLIVVAIAGTGEVGIRTLVRATARSSVVLFTLAFAASALRRVWPSAPTRWLLANRRQFGVSFALSHLVHLLALLALFGWSLRRFVTESEGVTLVFGGVAYVFIAAMTVTSFDRTAAWLGPRRWKRLHTTGAYYIWFIFALNFVALAFQSPLYWPFAGMLVGSLALRIAAFLRARRGTVAMGATLGAKGTSGP